MWSKSEKWGEKWVVTHVRNLFRAALYPVIYESIQGNSSLRRNVTTRGGPNDFLPAVQHAGNGCLIDMSLFTCLLTGTLINVVLSISACVSVFIYWPGSLPVNIEISFSPCLWNHLGGDSYGEERRGRGVNASSPIAMVTNLGFVSHLPLATGVVAGHGMKPGAQNV